MVNDSYEVNNCVLGCFRPFASGADREAEGWHALANDFSDIFRKEEFDWKMVYLARREGTNKASISWKIDLTGELSVTTAAEIVVNPCICFWLVESGTCVELVDVEAQCKTYEDAAITWTICSEKQCSRLPKGNLNASKVVVL